MIRPLFALLVFLAACGGRGDFAEAKGGGGGRSSGRSSGGSSSSRRRSASAAASSCRSCYQSGGRFYTRTYMIFYLGNSYPCVPCQSNPGPANQRTMSTLALFGTAKALLPAVDWRPDVAVVGTPEFKALCDSFSAGNLTEQLLTDPLIWSSSLILTNVTVTPDPRVHLSSADRHHPAVPLLDVHTVTLEWVILPSSGTTFFSTTRAIANSCRQASTQGSSRELLGAQHPSTTVELTTNQPDGTHSRRVVLWQCLENLQWHTIDVDSILGEQIEEPDDSRDKLIEVLVAVLTYSVFGAMFAAPILSRRRDLRRRKQRGSLVRNEGYCCCLCYELLMEKAAEKFKCCFRQQIGTVDIPASSPPVAVPEVAAVSAVRVEAEMAANYSHACGMEAAFQEEQVEDNSAEEVIDHAGQQRQQTDTDRDHVVNTNNPIVN